MCSTNPISVGTSQLAVLYALPPRTTCGQGAVQPPKNTTSLSRENLVGKKRLIRPQTCGHAPPSIGRTSPTIRASSAGSTIGVGESPSIPTLPTDADPANAVFGVGTSQLAVLYAPPPQTACGEKNSSVSTPRDRERADYSLDGDSSREQAPDGTNQINPVI